MLGLIIYLNPLSIMLNIFLAPSAMPGPIALPTFLAVGIISSTK